MDIAHQPTAEAKQYLHAASVLFNLTLTSSEWVPLWGTCMGLQTLSVLAAGTQTCAVHNEWCVETDRLYIIYNIYYIYIYTLYIIVQYRAFERGFFGFLWILSTFFVRSMSS